VAVNTGVGETGIIMVTIMIGEIGAIIRAMVKETMDNFITKKTGAIPIEDDGIPEFFTRRAGAWKIIVWDIGCGSSSSAG
jgi:hypothetical protein